jgi:predicted nuclease with TOPRIM domain
MIFAVTSQGAVQYLGSPVKFGGNRPRWMCASVLCLVLSASAAFAGISRAVQDEYRRAYENKALFLKIPVFSEKQMLFIIGRGIRPEQPTASAPRFKVGDQVRILALDFGRDEIRFKVSGIQGAVPAEIIFKFDGDLLDHFPNRQAFDTALAATFTEGLKYSDVEEAKRGYVEQEFESHVREIASTTGTSREFVLKSLTSRVPAYQDALRDIENLKNRSQEMTGQLTQAQAENRRQESELKQQQAELTRLKNLNASLQEKIDSSSTQLGRVSDELKAARGATQTYQSQLTNLQRSLNLKVDENRDLASQIGDLAQVTRKLQKDNEALTGQNASLRSTIETLETNSKRLSGEVEDLKAANGKMRETIETLSSKEDSLARQYLQLKKTKESLEDIRHSVESLNTQIVEEKSERGFRISKIRLYLRNIPLGTLESRLPEYLTHNQSQAGEAHLTTESIDYVRVSPEERQLLRSLGERLKVGVKLSSPESSFEVRPEKDGPVQEIGERDSATWRWSIVNRGTQDTRLQLNLYLVNKNSDEVSVLKEEHLVLSSSVVRQVRNYLQPIPMGLGAVIGFLLFAIVGAFRKGKKSHLPHPAARPSEPSGYARQKQL